MCNDFTDRLQAAIADPQAAENLRNYLRDNDGQHFETYGLADTATDRIAPADLVAVTCLSMRIQRDTNSGFTPELAVAIERRSSELSALLAVVPTDIEMHQLDEAGFERHLGPNSPAHHLYVLLRDDFEVPRVATHKLLARKRPGLIPIRDTVVERRLGNPHEWWHSWWNALNGDLKIVATLDAIRTEAGAPAARLRLLRVADIVIWSGSKNPGSPRS